MDNSSSFIRRRTVDSRSARKGTDFFRGGDLVNGLTGVLHWSFAGGTSPDAWRIRPTAATPATFTVANPRPATPPAVGGAIRAASVNVLNYFTTLNVRGADSAAELNRQRERTSIVLCALNADVAALMEIENTPPTPPSPTCSATSTRAAAAPIRIPSSTPAEPSAPMKSACC